MRSIFLIGLTTFLFLSAAVRAQEEKVVENFPGVLQRNITLWNRGTFDHSSPQAIAQVYLDIVKGKKIDLSVIDFSIGVEGNGPTKSVGGRTINMKERLGSWAVVASSDIMAADATAARIMSHDVEKIKQLTMGFEMGLGEIREESIEMLGEKLDNLRVTWKPARLMGHAAKK